ncbi:MAG: VTT domain-containing protein [Bdellovibrionaceae bacterium]|nr:VTT domain-containing protein [Pseudobdellovibrionaceae bacterium]
MSLRTIPFSGTAGYAVGLMDALVQFFIALFHDMPTALEGLSQTMGPWVYVILFLIVFAETGLVVTPFLPGDSLLFAAGAVCALPGAGLNVWILGLALIVAALSGDFVNYNVGRWASKRLVANGKIAFVKQEHLVRTEAFFLRHGGKTIVLARFLPIIRTYAPFVAGAAKMHWLRFLSFSVGGAISWITIFLSLGFLFGNQPYVRANFKFVIIAIILISVAPAAIEFVRSRRKGIHA